MARGAAALEAGRADEAPAADFVIDPEAVREALESGARVELRMIGDGDADGTVPPVKRGRPRSSTAHLAILQAALDLLADVGYDGVSMEAVAQRAGVSKATVYRRWTSKMALVLELLESIAASHAEPDTGSVRDDLRQMVARVELALVHSQYGAVLTALASELPRNPEMAETFRTHFLAARRSGMLAVLRRGVERGELRADADLELVIDLLVGPLYYRVLVSGMPLSPAYAAAIVDHVVDGAAPPGRSDSVR